MRLLVFGGENYKCEVSQESFQLQIDMDKNTCMMTYLPKARLRRADFFLDNQSLHVNNDINVVTMVGKQALTRINTSAPIDKLRWTKYGRKLGYETQIDVSQQPKQYTQLANQNQSPAL